MKIKALQNFSSSDCKGSTGEIIDVPEQRANWLVDNGYCAHLDALPKKALASKKAAPPAKPKKK